MISIIISLLLFQISVLIAIYGYQKGISYAEGFTLNFFKKYLIYEAPSLFFLTGAVSGFTNQFGGLSKQSFLIGISFYLLRFASTFLVVEIMKKQKKSSSDSNRELLNKD